MPDRPPLKVVPSPDAATLRREARRLRDEAAHTRDAELRRTLLHTAKRIEQMAAEIGAGKD